MDYTERAKLYTKEYILKNIEECEKDLERPCRCANDRFIHNNIENWLKYWKKLLKEKEIIK
mgnify:CR=1 FL=1